MSEFKWVNVDPKKKRVVVKKDWEGMLSHMDFSSSGEKVSGMSSAHEEQNSTLNIEKTPNSCTLPNSEEKEEKQTKTSNASSTKERMSIPNLLNPSPK